MLTLAILCDKYKIMLDSSISIRPDFIRLSRKLGRAEFTCTIEGQITQEKLEQVKDSIDSRVRRQRAHIKRDTLFVQHHFAPLFFCARQGTVYNEPLVILRVCLYRKLGLLR